MGKQYKDRDYAKDPAWRSYGVLDKLRALGPTPDPEDVDRIIGNNGWSRTFCGECHDYHLDAVLFGEGYDSFALCKGCLSLAIATLSEP